jgi:hypothetical protein
MSKPLTMAVLKRMKERIDADAGAYDAETTAFIEKEYKLALRRQKVRRKKAVTKRRSTLIIRKKKKHISGPASTSVGRAAYIPPKKGLPLKAKERNVSLDGLAWLKADEERHTILQRVPPAKPKRRSPRTGLAKFGITL